MTEQHTVDTADRRRAHDAGAARDRGGVALGIALVVLGAVFLIAQSVEVDIGEAGWPFFVIAPGIVLLVAGLVLGGRPAVGLTIAGSIVTTVGLILLYQNSTAHWESWAYAWALIPTAIGLGMLLHGSLHRLPDLARAGVRTAGTGAILFIIFAAFFEGVIGIGGDRFGRLDRSVLPLALIGLGVVLTVTAFVTRRPRPPVA